VQDGEVGAKKRVCRFCRPRYLGGINGDAETIPFDSVGNVQSPDVSNNQLVHVKRMRLEGGKQLSANSCSGWQCGASCGWNGKCKKQVPLGPPKVASGGFNSGIEVRSTQVVPPRKV
jgi:hypothetical protein